MDEAVINDYLTRYDITSISSQMIQDEINYWSVLLCYEDKKGKSNSGKISINSEEELSDEENIIYSKLKDWRLEKSKIIQQPSYVIFHNSHLMSIAKLKPVNLEDLQHVNGLGKSKIEKYGIEILEVLENA